jgi:hypothetical protein
LFLQKYEALVPHDEVKRPVIRLFGFKIADEDESDDE